MAKHIFTSLIKCTNCNKNYVFIKDRNIPKYVCGGYSNRNGCTKRFAINEEDLLKMVKIYCNRNQIGIEQSNDFMKRIIDKIYIDSQKENIMIKYKNEEIQEISDKKGVV